MDLGIEGRTSVITGGSVGIGKAVAHALAAEGANVVLLARTKETLDEAAEELRAAHPHVAVLPHPTDVTDRASVDAAAAAVSDRFGTVHVLVNNAGHRMRRFDRQVLWDDDDWQADLDNKLVGLLRTVRAFVPHLATDGTGRVVNVSGAAGSTVWEGALTHGLNNAAVDQATRYLARDLAGSQITVNSVVPGLVATEWRHGWAKMMADKAGITSEDFLAGYCSQKGILAGRWGEPDEVADAVAFLASERGRYVTATCLAVDGGMGANPR